MLSIVFIIMMLLLTVFLLDLYQNERNDKDLM